MKADIRTATLNDASAIAGVVRSSFVDVADKFEISPRNAPTHPSNCTTDWIEGDLNSGTCYLVAELESGIVGCVAFKPIDRATLEAQRLAIIPVHRGGELAQLLNEAVLRHAEKSGFSRIRIAIVAQHRALKRWYSRMGFVERETKAFSHLPFKVTYMDYEISKSH